MTKTYFFIIISAVICTFQVYEYIDVIQFKNEFVLSNSEKAIWSYNPSAVDVIVEESIHFQKINNNKTQAGEINSSSNKNTNQLQQQSNDGTEALANSKHIILILSLLLFVCIIIMIIGYKTIIDKIRTNAFLEKKNEHIHKINKEQNKFFSIVTHELRTPLYGIIGLTELISEEKKQKIRKKYFESLQFSSRHMANFVNNIMQFTKSSIDRLKVVENKVNIESLIKNIISSFYYDFQKNNIKIHLSIKTKTDEIVLTDSVKFSQIFINLLSNAIRYTQDGDIWINVNRKKDSLNDVTYAFSVKDNGEGITESLQKAIKLQSHNYKHEILNGSGLGLGLLIINKNLELFKSSMAFTSKIGKGSEFCFEINFKKHLSAIKEPKELISLKGYKILAIDDDNMNLLITRKTLMRLNANCDTCDNGYDGIEMVKKHHYDLVLLDINMPKINGFETVSSIRVFNPKIPIIALTALDQGIIKNKARKHGFNGVITKPYKLNNLYNTIISKLAKKSA